MAENLLIIHPRDPDGVPDDINALNMSLTEAGFLGETFDFNGNIHYKPGDQFLQLITFMGCSPVVSLGEPGSTGDEFCHIAITDSLREISAHYGDNTKPPRCPSCDYREENWKEAIEEWRNDRNNYLWNCPECGNQYPLPELKWRQCAGFGRFSITVWGIFEGEAVPSDQLLTMLENESGFVWNYFYLRNN